MKLKPITSSSNCQIKPTARPESARPESARPESARFGLPIYFSLGLFAYSFFPLQIHQEVAEKKPSEKVEQKDKQQAEFERRLDSIARTTEKEERPATPSFKDRAGTNGSITFDDLKFEMRKSERFKRDMLTDSINGLVGERLKLKGYVHPNSKNRGMKKFIFVRDDKECCFGPTAALYDCVLVSLAEGEKGKYSLRPVTVEGDFFLKEFNGPDGRVWAVYRMKNGVIK